MLKSENISTSKFYDYSTLWFITFANYHVWWEECDIIDPWYIRGSVGRHFKFHPHFNIFLCIWDIFEVFLKTNVWHFWRKQDAMTLPIHKSQSSSTTIQAPLIKRFLSLFSNKLIIFQFDIHCMPCKNRMTFVSSLESIIVLDCLKKYFIFFV